MIRLPGIWALLILYGHDCAGNINQLILKAESYLPALVKTQGVIAEFVNPKYKDDTRTAFKSSTRLECMMQDFPHGLPSDASVGFTVVNQVRPAHLLTLRSHSTAAFSGKEAQIRAFA